MNFLEIKQEVKHNLRLSLPLVTSQLLYSATFFLGTLMLAHLGKATLAANVLISTLWLALSVVFFGILNAASILIAHQYGAKSKEGVSVVAGQTCLLSVILIIFILLILQMAPWFLQFTHQSPLVLKLANKSLFAIKFWIAPLTWLIMLEQLLIGLGKTRVVMCVSVLLVPLEILFIYAFIFGGWHFPKTGIAGVGYGVALADSIGCLSMVFYLAHSKGLRKYRLFSKLKPNFTYLKELVIVGLPMGLMSFIECGAFAIMTYVIARFGVTQLAAHQIIMQYLGLIIGMVFAMSQAVSVRVGHAVGALDLTKVKQVIKVGMLLNFCVMLLLGLLMYSFPRWLMGFDLDIHALHNHLLVQQATPLFRLAAILLLFDNFRIIGFGALRGLKDTAIPMWTSFIGFCIVGLSLGFVFGTVKGLQTQGVWLGMVLGILSGAVLMNMRLVYVLKRVDLQKILAIK